MATSGTTRTRPDFGVTSGKSDAQAYALLHEFVHLSGISASGNEVYNHQGQKVLAYNVFRCWVSEYQALPQLDAGGNAVMITTIKLENEGWVRDPIPELKET